MSENATEKIVPLEHVISVLKNLEDGYNRRLDAIGKRLEKCEYDSEREVLRRRVAELERIIAAHPYRIDMEKP